MRRCIERRASKINKGNTVRLRLRRGSDVLIIMHGRSRLGFGGKGWEIYAVTGVVVVALPEIVGTHTDRGTQVGERSPSRMVQSDNNSILE